MTETRRPDPADDDAALSAWLLGELSDEDAAAVEAGLRADPAAARRADALAEALTELADLAAVQPPVGYEQRLRARLDAERTGTAGVGDLDAARDRREQRRRRWSAISTAAAAVAVMGLAGGYALGELGAQRADRDLAMEADAEMAEVMEAAPFAADEPGAASLAAPEPELQRQTPDDGADDGFGAGGSDSGGGASGGAAHDTADSAPAAAAAGPVIVDDDATLADERAVRAYYADLPEAHALLGTDLARARERAAEHLRALREAPAFRSGTRPEACVEAAAAAREKPVVVARAEWVRYAGEWALAHVVVTASPGADALDRIEVWISGPNDCAPRLAATL